MRRSCIRVSETSEARSRANEWLAAPSGAVSEQNRRLKDRRKKKKSLGWLAERSNAAVLKTVDGATHPGVRIPHHPP